MRYLLFILTLLFSLSCSTTVESTDSLNTKAPFKDGKFDNIEPFPDKNFFQLLRWKIGSLFKVTRWEKPENQKFFKVNPSRSESLKVAVISHSTVLIQINNLNILTDPHYSQRASPVSWAGPERVIEPGIKFEDLPPIDAILISHNHYDHLDLSTLKKLSQKYQPKIYVGLNTKKLLAKAGITNVIEMDWWDKIKVGSVDISFVPVQHWSARSLFDKRESLWGGFVVAGNKKIFFAGDTGYGKVFKTIHEKFGDMDLSLIPIGAYEPRYFMKNAHINPEESVKVFSDLKSKKAVGIHFGTFNGLTDEAYGQPAIDLSKAMQSESITNDRFIAPEFGRLYSIE